jgi:hypothetical protein
MSQDLTTDTDINEVEWEAYDFIDLGCSKGDSIVHCRKRFGVERGAGIDLSPAKVARTQELGFDAYLADAATLDLQKRVSFISMMNFLEHIPNVEIAASIIAAAARSAKDFLFIRNPSFEGEAVAEHIGYRQYWWNWRPHPCHMTVADYCEIFDSLGLSSYKIRYIEKITDTSHDTVIPIDMAINVNAKTAKETVTPAVALAAPWWRRQDIFVALRPFEPAEWAEITRPVKQDIAYMKAGGQTWSS